MATHFSGPIGQLNESLPPALNSQTYVRTQAPDQHGSFFVPRIDSLTRMEFGFSPREMVHDIRTNGSELGDDGQYLWWGFDLPPKEYWIENPFEIAHETPADDNGIIKIKDLIEVCTQAVRSEYRWPTNWTRDDHLYWSEAAYIQLAHKLGSSLPVVFRNLPTNIIRFPLAFEQWKHHLTIPSDFPTIDAMHESVRAWGAAESLFYSIADAVKLERQRRERREGLRTGTLKLTPRFPDDRDSENYFIQALADRHRGLAIEFNRNMKISEEYRIIAEDATSNDVWRQLSYMIRHRHRDGIRSRKFFFEPFQADTPAGENVPMVSQEVA